MKAIRVLAPGGPEQLTYADVDAPQPRPGDALVRVYATGISPAELTWIRTFPNIPGHEMCGVVEGTGERVYGLIDFDRAGAAAEYVAVVAQDLAPAPHHLDNVQAAAVPLSALTAWQALFDHAQLRGGQRVLIHGGTGGVGSYAVQLARWRGAQVITTTSARNAEIARELGAGEVIDYASVEFEKVIHDVDVVLDTMGGTTRDRSWKVLRPGGMIVSIAEPMPEKLPQGARGLFFIVKPSRDQLIEIGRLIEAGSLRPIVSRVFPLERAREAYELGAVGHMRGKIVLQVAAGAAQQGH